MTEASGASPSPDVSEKVAFASPEWVVMARAVLEELVAEHGETGVSFSACEVFTDAPKDLAGPEATTAAWHFRIVDKTVTVGEGEITGAEMNARVDYETVLPAVRMVYTPEMIKQAQSMQPAGAGDGKPAVPSYLVELHNRMAVLTK